MQTSTNESFQQGDIVWVDFPFSDKPATSKKRPALIVSNWLSHQLDNDLLMVPLTSAIREEYFSIGVSDGDVESPLPVRSEIRCNKIFTIRNTLILGKLTVLKTESLEKVIEKIRQCTYLERKGKLFPFGGSPEG